MGVEGFEPPQPEGTAFTARPGSPTPAHTQLPIGHRKEREVRGKMVFRSPGQVNPLTVYFRLIWAARSLSTTSCTFLYSVGESRIPSRRLTSGAHRLFRM